MPVSIDMVYREVTIETKHYPTKRMGPGEGKDYPDYSLQPRIVRQVVRVEIDVAALTERIGKKATRSTRGQATAYDGLIKAKLVSTVEGVKVKHG